MRMFEVPAELAAAAGEELGTSPWLPVPQQVITAFADLTGDHTWIHVDPVRAAKELPGGTTIAHGYLTLSLAPQLMGQIYEVRRLGQIFNYGADNLRFTGMVPAGARIRLRLTLKAAQHRDDGGIKFTFGNTLEVEGSPRPVLVYDMLVLMYPPAP